MQALRGLSRADTLRLVEIETYVTTGKRPDGLQITDAWINEVIEFLAAQLRPTLDAWVEMGHQVDRYMPVVIAAGKVQRARKRGARGSAMRSLYKELDEALENEVRLGAQVPNTTK